MKNKKTIGLFFLILAYQSVFAFDPSPEKILHVNRLEISKMK